MKAQRKVAKKVKNNRKVKATSRLMTLLLKDSRSKRRCRGRLEPASRNEERAREIAFQVSFHPTLSSFPISRLSIRYGFRRRCGSCFGLFGFDTDAIVGSDHLTLDQVF